MTTLHFSFLDFKKGYKITFENSYLSLRITDSFQIVMENYKVKTSFVRPEWPKARAMIKTGLNSMILILIFAKNCP